MRFCVVGAGAIGGFLAAQLIAAGNEVTIIARGATLAALRARGLRLLSAAGDRTFQPALATDDTAAAGVQQAVIIAVKAQQLPALAPSLPPLIGAETMVVPAQNGLPFWYFARFDGPHAGYRIRTVDPDGVVAASIPAESIIGCTVYPAAEQLAPGVIRHIENNRLTLGELDGSKSERLRALTQALIEAGLKAPVRSDIRDEIWMKLWGNATFNPLSALTRATLGGMAHHPQTRALLMAAMAEVQSVGAAFGAQFPLSIEQRIAAVEPIKGHKTSMLQDIEAGRRTEIDALTGAVCEVARLVGVPTPHLDTLYAAVTLLEQKP